MIRIINICFLFLATTLLAQTNSALSRYNFAANNPEQFLLPAGLEEISGITLVGNGLYCHNDEKGTIYKFDLQKKKIVKSFNVGSIFVNEDFEDIEYVKGKFYLLISSGDFFMFEEGNNNSTVTFKKIVNNFSSKFDFEGLCHDPKSNSLLLASKKYAGKNYQKRRAVYSYSLSESKIMEKPRFLICPNELKVVYGVSDFFPSAIVYNPEDDTYLILSSKGEPAIAELNSDGAVINAVKLNADYHQQPEGLSLLKNGTLVISDEGAGGYGKLTFYPKSK